MRFRLFKHKVFLLVIAYVFYGYPCIAWGVYGHKHINRAAILALPVAMGQFFYDHADYITEESVVPDIRKYTLGDKNEFPKHYINLETYHYTTADSMPQTMKDALTKYSRDTLMKEGMLPWYIQDMMDKLTEAFRQKHTSEILLLAADLGHYIADAHMPLHTSVNHNGQLTGQEGIHALWESQLPEMFGGKYNLHTGPVHYIADITHAAWSIVAHSYGLVDSMLIAEKTIEKNFPENKIYLLDSAGNIVRNQYKQPVFSVAFVTAYNKALHGMIERQMSEAIAAVADFWYTAWVNAGRPDLNDLDPQTVISRNRTYYKQDELKWKTGKVPGLAPEYEFPVK